MTTKALTIAVSPPWNASSRSQNLYPNSGTIRLGLRLKSGILRYVLFKEWNASLVLYLRVETCAFLLALKHLLLPRNSCSKGKCAFALSRLRTLSRHSVSFSHLLNSILLRISTACLTTPSRYCGICHCPLGHLLILYYRYGQFAFCLAPIRRRTAFCSNFICSLSTLWLG